MHTFKVEDGILTILRRDSAEDEWEVVRTKPLEPSTNPKPTPIVDVYMRDPENRTPECQRCGNAVTIACALRDKSGKFWMCSNCRVVGGGEFE